MQVRLTITKGIAWVAGLAFIAVVAPSLYAQTAALNAETHSAAAIEAEESVVIAPTDEPLTRAAKLRREWVVYREVGSKQIWAITTSGSKREITTLSFFSAFDANYRIELVAAGRLSAFPTGDMISSVDGLVPTDFRKRPFACRLVKSAENPAVYLVCFGHKRVIVREGVFHNNGWEFRDVETVAQSELDAIPTETSVDEQTVFQEEVTVDTTEKRMERERLEKRLELQGKTEVKKRLVKAIGKPDVYLIDEQGRRRHIKDMTTVQAHGLDLGAVTEVTVEELEAFPEGPEITGTSNSMDLNKKVGDTKGKTEDTPRR